MTKKTKEKELTFEDLIDAGVLQIIRTLGKGEDLRAAVWAICASTANWSEDQAKKKD